MTQSIDPSPVASRRFRRLGLGLAMAVLGGCVLLWVGVKWQRHPAPPAPPVLDPVGVDPAVWRAIDEARDGVLREPSAAWTWGRLGMILLAHQFHGEATTCLAQAEQFAPDDVRWPYFQGFALLRADPDAALVCFHRAVELADPTMDAPRLQLAELLVQRGRLDEAETQLHNVLAKDANNSRAHLCQARVAFERDDLASTLQHLRQSADNQCTRKATCTFLAQVHQRHGKRAETEQASRKARDLPDDLPWPDPIASQFRGLVTGRLMALTRGGELLRQDRIPEAIDVLQQAVADYPGSSYAWLLLGRTHLRNRNVAGAEQAFQKAEEKDSRSVEVQFYLGVVLFLQSKPGEAAKRFRKAIELKPDHAMAYYNLGHCLKQQGDPTAAITAFRTTIACNPQFADAYVNLGELVAGKGETAAALEHLQRAVQLAPADPHARRLRDNLLRQTDASRQ